MPLEGYLQQLVEKRFFCSGNQSGASEGSGIVWENGLLVYRTGPLPAHIVDDAVRRFRDERSRHIPGDFS